MYPKHTPQTFPNHGMPPQFPNHGMPAPYPSPGMPTMPVMPGAPQMHQQGVGPQPILNIVTDQGCLDFSGQANKATLDAENPILLSGSPMAGTQATGFGCVIGLVHPNCGNLTNAMMRNAQPLVDGTNHIRFLQASQSPGTVTFGLSNDAKYASGWGASGIYLMPNGNLATQNLDVPGFCSGYKAGQIVDWFIDVNSPHVDIFLLIDGVNQGLAWTLRFNNPSVIQTLRPALRFDDQCTNTKAYAITHRALTRVSHAPWRDTRGKSPGSTTNPFN